jgi:hypothetical protein
MKEDKNQNKYRNKMENCYYMSNKDKNKMKEIKKTKDENENNNILNYCAKKNLENKFLKKTITHKRALNNRINDGNSYLNSMNVLNNNLNLNYQEKTTYHSKSNKEIYDKEDNNINDNINLKKNSSKIPHLINAKKKFQQKLINDIIDTPFKKIKTTNSNNSSSRKNSHKNIKQERNFHNFKRIENLNNALSFIREKKRMNYTNIEKKKAYISYNTCSSNNNRPNSGGKFSTSYMTNSNTNANTQSYSQSKEKNIKPPKALRKANSGSFNSKGEYLCQNTDEMTNIESNKNQIIMCLKYKISFNKLYEKIDALEKINSTNLSNKSNFLILCEYKMNQFIFSGLFKYHQDKERYIKIYGNERSPNYILLKDIKSKLKFKIYEDNSQTNYSVRGFISMNHFRFTSNAIIIIKN